MKITAIVNGISTQLDRCLEELNQAEANIQVRITQGSGDASLFAQDACNSGSEFIIACGGDGTLNECLNGMLSSINPNCLLGLFPIGSANDYARVIGSVSISQLVKSAENRISDMLDIGVIRWNNQERYFCNISAAGIGAEIARTFNARRFKVGTTINYYSAIVQWLSTFNAPDLEIIIDAQTYSGKTLLAAIGKGIYAGNGLALLPQSELTDGLLGLTIATNVGVFDFIRFQGRLKKGKRIKDSRVQYLKGTQIEILVKNGALAIDADGEFTAQIRKGETVSFSILRNKLNLVRPNTDTQITI
jgi:diacylglycerol kinase (ATP)